VRHPIREDIRVGVPITLEPGPARIFLPIHQQVFLGPGFTTRLAKLGGQRSIFAPTIGFAGLRWPSLAFSVFSGHRELLGADGTWV
jgi:hypothetical protein